jgi:hypothetical protein
MVTMPTAKTPRTSPLGGMSAASAAKYGGCHSLTKAAFVLTVKTAPVINSDWIGAALFLVFIVCVYSLTTN